MMLFSFSRAALISLIVLAPSIASARTFSGEFIAVESEEFVSATATVNYRNRSLDVSLLPKMPICPEGQFCIQAFPPAQDYAFTNVTSKTDRCGVVTTTAVDDQIPVDGIRTEVTLVNKQNQKCKSRFGEVLATLLVKKAWYNRLEGRRVETLDAFAFDPKPYIISSELSSVSSERYESATVSFDSRTRIVTLGLKSVDAPADEEVFVQKLPKAKITVDSCRIIRTVAFIDNRPADGALLEVSISDNRKNTCPTFAALAEFDVLVKQSYYSRLNQGEVEFVDTFKSK